MTYYSHPPEEGNEGVLLEAHLRDVAERVCSVVPEDAETAAGDPLRAVAERLALVHDFGKLSTYFQQHIGVRDGTPPRKELSHHSLFGGVLAHYVLDRGGFADGTCLAGFLAVARHHGRLVNTADYVFERTSWGGNTTEQDAVLEQVADVDGHLPEWADDLVRELTDGNGSWEAFVSEVVDERGEGRFGRINDHVSMFGDAADPTLVPDGCYPDTLRLWSALVLADKTGAAMGPDSPISREETYAPGPVPTAAVESHISGLEADAEATAGRTGRLNELRKEARQEVLGNVRPDTELGTLTLPTGFGKTLTGVNAALKLRDLSDRDRVVYALPFTSIIDQVGDELTEVFDGEEHEPPTLHHHLAEAVKEVEDAALETDERARLESMLGESWRGGLVLTTFVQLFESLAGPKNTQSMKLSALHGSVVVLDEPQALPHRWWPLVRRLVGILIEAFDAAVIAMTATHPRIFDHETTPLVERSERYFEAVERVEYELAPSVLTFPDGETLAYPAAARRVCETEGGSSLAVCNTIDSAEALHEAVAESTETVAVGAVYETLLNAQGGPEAGTVDPAAVADEVAERSGRPLLHLSTRVRPRDRLTLIEAAKRLTERDVPLVAVSTQLVEAGVDISFDQVFRDFAPMDSIVQAAGRCNRSFEHETGQVVVWRLPAPEGKSSDTPPGEAVYNRFGESRLSMTKQALDAVRDDEAVLSGPTVTAAAVKRYYEAVREANPGAHDWTDLVDHADAESLGEKSLIEQRLAVDVVVCRTERDEGLVEQASAAWAAREFDRVDTLLDELRPLQVSVPIYTEDSDESEAVMNLEPLHPETDTRVLKTDSNRLEHYFDPETGFVVPDSTVEARFL